MKENMVNVSRIPAYDHADQNGMLLWFSEMAVRDLLFHPEDDPRGIIRIADGRRLFTDSECRELGNILSRMFAEHGDAVIEACYPIFMRKAGVPSALHS